ncbi:LamG domain-containing protein [Aeoliella sp.]|uniref:LamG domain-containing protein n=1 Tax=Aeoliella sp. TaxID=2795800 RepID=UPI003CCB7A36
MRLFALLSMAAVALAAIPTIATAGLVGHYALDDGSGLTAADSAANPLPGTLTGDATPGGSTSGNGTFDSPDWVGGVSGTALSFGDFYTNSTTFGPKIDDVVEVANSGAGSKYEITGAISISAWVNLDSNSANGRKSTRHIAGRDTAGGPTGDVFSLKHRMGSSADLLEFLIDDPSTGNVNLAAAETLTTYQSASTHNGWVHVVGVFSPDDYMRIYVDGSLEGEYTEAVDGVPAAIDNSDAGATPLTIGRLNNSDEHSFYGSIDDVQFYDMALSDDEVAYLFANPGATVPEPTAVLTMLGMVGVLAAVRRHTCS